MSPRIQGLALALAFNLAWACTARAAVQEPVSGLPAKPADPAAGDSGSGEAVGGPDLFDLATRRPGELESHLEKAFSRLLGSPENLELEIEGGKLSERLGGRFARISARFRGGKFDRLAVAEARVEALDVHYDLPALLAGRTFAPRSVGETRLWLRIDESAINETVESVRGKLRVDGPRFDLKPGRIAFRGKIKFLFMRQDARIEGGLSVRRGSELHFRAEDVAVAGIPLPGFLVRALERRFNPVVRLDRAAFWRSFGVRLGKVEIGDGWITVESEGLPSDGSVESEDLVPADETEVPVLAGESDMIPGRIGEGRVVGKAEPSMIHSGPAGEAF